MTTIATTTTMTIIIIEPSRRQQSQQPQPQMQPSYSWKRNIEWNARYRRCPRKNLTYKSQYNERVTARISIKRTIETHATCVKLHAENVTPCRNKGSRIGSRPTECISKFRREAQPRRPAIPVLRRIARLDNNDAVHRWNYIRWPAGTVYSRPMTTVDVEKRKHKFDRTGSIASGLIDASVPVNSSMHRGLKNVPPFQYSGTVEYSSTHKIKITSCIARLLILHIIINWWIFLTK